MRVITFNLLFLILIIPVAAQNRIGFAYDDAGNRVRRELVIDMNSARKSRFNSDNSFHDSIGGLAVEISQDATGNIYIRIPQITPADIGRVDVYNIEGSFIFTCPVSGSETTIDLSSNPAGLYILKVTVNGSATTWKITIK